MACDVPCMSYMALYVISMHIVNSNSRSSASSHHWKINLSAGKVEPASPEPQGNGNRGNNTKHTRSTNSSADNNTDAGDEDALGDRMMDILTNKEMLNGEWIVSSSTSHSHDGNAEKLSEYLEKDNGHYKKDCGGSTTKSRSSSQPSKKCSCNCKDSGGKSQEQKLSKDRGKVESTQSKKAKPLTCGKKVNSTQYDHLRGISARHLQTYAPEPDVAMVFQNSGKTSEVDMNDLEHKLRKAKRDVEKSGSSQREQTAQVYNLIGNFWRIKGNTQTSIECFRKALSISPDDPDILLNLARVLFNLQFLDDAIFLARRSLHLQPSGHNSWLQHYTLGEILKSYGHPQEAALHFNQALELNPGFQPAKSHLRDLDSEPSPSVTHLTIFIILFLVVAVLFCVVTSIETNFQDGGVGDSSKTQQRHFNRAMAMRSIKLGINPRMCRLRKINS